MGVKEGPEALVLDGDSARTGPCTIQPSDNILFLFSGHPNENEKPLDAREDGLPTLAPARA